MTGVKAANMPGSGAKITPQVEPDTGGLSVVKPKTIETEGLSPRVVSFTSGTATNAKEATVDHWIPRHINKRICCQFIPQKGQEEKEDGLCQCNYLWSKHSIKAQRAFSRDETVWRTQIHTESLPTDAFGEIEFVGYGQRLGKYVRMDDQTPVKRALALMIDHWGLDRPNLLISVTGGAKNFHMRPRLKEVFRRGLMKAAASTGAWITTGGNHAGVMKHVGEAVQEYTIAHGLKTKVFCIGIAPWGCVQNKEHMRDPKGSWPAQYRMEGPKQRKESPIDRNHSHFILIDNGTQHSFGTEISFRAKLESVISEMKTDTGNSDHDDGVSVPAVCLVLEGGPGTLETVKSAIQSGTPAVIVDGSGRAADILAYTYNNSREEEVEVKDKLGRSYKHCVALIDDDVWTEVRRMIKEEFGEKALDQRLMWVKECFQRRDHITVFNLDGGDGDSSKDIDVAILHALLKVNKDQDVTQLKLALAWNRVDVARSLIFTEDKKWDPSDLHEVMYSAVMANRVDFIKLIMENGLSLKDFLTVKRMLQLYNNIPKNSLLYSMLKKEKKKGAKEFSLEDVGSVIQSLMGDFYTPLYTKDNRYKDLDVFQILHPDSFVAKSHVSLNDSHVNPMMAYDLTSATNQQEEMYDQGNGQVIKGLTKFMFVDKTTGEKYALADFDEPARELFIWSVLMNRVDMAMHFWDEGREGTAAALVALRMLKSMLTKTDDSELIKELTALIEHFEELSVGLLAECYVQDEKRAGLMLVREMNLFGDTTILMLAVEADNKTFIAHAACQTLLNNIWMGRLSNDVGVVTMAACIFMPPVIYLLMRYKENERQLLAKEREQQDKTLQLERQKTMLNDQNELEMKHLDRVRSPEMGRHDSKEKLFADNPKEFNRRLSVRKPMKTDSYSCLDKLIFFYNAPVITFMHNCLSYIVFLVLFSLVLLIDFHESMSVSEYILIVWVVTLFAEEVRQVVSHESNNFFLKFVSYISDVWNILDVISIGLFIAGMIVRNIDCAQCVEAGRIVLALCLMMFWFRILHIFSVHKELGPKLVMIGRMMVDLAFFVVILMVFIIAYGVASQVVLYPNSEFGLELLRDVLKKPYFQMYGELFLEEIEGEIECSFDPAVYGDGSTARCPENTWLVPVMLGGYILITNVLMLNLLIAMFSYTFDKVNERTDQHWHYLRFFIIREYHDRPPLVPPLICIAHIYMIVRAMLRKCCRSQPENNMFRMRLSESEERQLIIWENMAADEYLRRTQADEQETMEAQVKATNERVDAIAVKVEELAEASLMMQTSNKANASSQAKLPPVLDERITYIEEQLKRTARALDWIIESMVEKGQGSRSGKPQLMNVDELKEEAQKRKEDAARKEKEKIHSMLSRQLELHVKSRDLQYPCEYKMVVREKVTNEQVPWDVVWKEYNPVVHTDNEVLQSQIADPDIMTLSAEDRRTLGLPFNEYDTSRGIDRHSYEGKYEVTDGLPVNPHGRTGLAGRGKLWFWGPNHAGDPVVTRWSKDSNGEFIKENGKRVLEFISVQRADTNQWAIPGGMLGTNEPVSKCLKTEFSEEALGSLMDDKMQKDKIQSKLDELFSNGIEIYKGYSDDPRNTDNAWIETRAVNFHDEDGHILNNFKIRFLLEDNSVEETSEFPLRAGESINLVGWRKIDFSESMYAAHLYILKLVAMKHDAAF